MTYSLHAEFAEFKMQEARTAMQTGQFDIASKGLLSALTVNPTLEGYLLLSECSINLGAFEVGLGHLARAEEIARSTGRFAEVSTLISQRRAYCQGAVSKAKNEVPFDQDLWVRIPFRASKIAHVIERVNRIDGVSMTMRNLIHHNMYDIQIGERDVVLAETMLATAAQMTEPDANAINNHAHVFDLCGPTRAIAQRTKTQIQGARNFAHTLNVLLQALEAPAAYVGTAGITIPSALWYEWHSWNSWQGLIRRLVGVLKDPDTQLVWSTGMHALGRPDMRVDSRLVGGEHSKLFHEFAEFMLVTDKPLNDSLVFESATLGERYVVDLGGCDIYDSDHGCWNPYGRFTFVRKC